jgi:hypothetical protein
MTVLRRQAHAGDDVAGLSLRNDTPPTVCHGGFLDLGPAMASQDRVIAVVALLVALVHHRGSTR